MADLDKTLKTTWNGSMLGSGVIDTAALSGGFNVRAFPLTSSTAHNIFIDILY